MSTIISTLVPHAVTAPRVAPFAAQWFSALLRTFQSAGAVRVAQSKQSSRANEAEQLRRYARQFHRDHPSFAADLFTAADHHEA